MFWNTIEFIIPVIGSLYVLPQVIRSIKRGNAKGISKWLIVGWIANNGLSLMYVLHIGNKPLAIKYLLVLILVSVIAYYKRID